MIENFVDYLQGHSTGEGARSYYNRFKKMLKNAFRKEMMQVNVLDLVERTATGNARKKDTLTMDELKVLAATPIENKEIRRAALFCSLTCLAWVNVKPLTWDKISLDTRQLEL